MQRIITILFLLLVTHKATAAVVLQYHHVSSSTPRITSITVEEFHQHMAYLHEQKFNVIPIETLTRQLASGEAIADKTIVITFDDAYIDILDNAMPILNKYQFPATIFVATGLVGSSKQYLSWTQLRTLQAQRITMVNHTVSHTHLLRQNDNETENGWRERIAGEINNAQLALSTNLGDIEKIFAYPYGEYNAAVVGIIRELGYTAFGQQSGAIGTTSDPALLPRFPLSGVYTDFSSFKTKIMTLSLPTMNDFVEPLLTTENRRPPLQIELKGSDLSLTAMTCYGPGGRTETKHLGPQDVIVTAVQDLPVGRSRYNCTLRDESGRYFWYSQSWIRKKSDGTWYPEP